MTDADGDLRDQKTSTRRVRRYNIFTLLFGVVVAALALYIVISIRFFNPNNHRANSNDQTQQQNCNGGQIGKEKR